MQVKAVVDVISPQMLGEMDVSNLMYLSVDHIENTYALKLCSMDKPNIWCKNPEVLSYLMNSVIHDEVLDGTPATCPVITNQDAVLLVSLSEYRVDFFLVRKQRAP